VITYRAILDVPRPTVEAFTGWLWERRVLLGTRPGRRALGCWGQAVLVLRWLRQAADVTGLARDNGVSPATAYRYLHEGLDVLAAQAPDLHDAIAGARAQELTHLLLDGTLIGTDRCTARSASGHDAWYSGKHKRHGANVQVLADPAGFPLWVSDARPGSIHDITCARELVLPALYRHAARDLPVLADKGYTGAGIGIHVPARNPGGGQVLDPGTRTRNALLIGVRALGERANALLKTRWKALRHVTLDPSAITRITKAALVLTTMERGRY